MSDLKDRLRHHLSVAKDKSLHMQVLTDAAGHKVAQKLYHQYISDADYSKLPAFVQALDSLLARFGAAAQEGDAPQEDESPAEPEKPAEKKKDNRDNF